MHLRFQMPPKKQKRRESGKSRAAVVEESALSQVDIAFKQQLTDHYRKLVMTELNGPCALSSSFLGIRQSQQMADELASSQTLIPSLGSHGVFENGIPFYHMHIQTLNSDEYSRLEKNGLFDF